MRYRGEYAFLFILYLVKEAEIIIHNLILCMHHKYGDEVLRFFVKEALEAAWEDNWDYETQRVACSTDSFIEEEIEDDIRLARAQVFLDTYKKLVEA